MPQPPCALPPARPAPATSRPRRIGRWSGAGAVVLAAVLGLAACGSDTADGAGASPTGDAATEPALTGEVTVFAAASLTGAFTDLGDLFTAEHPDVTVTFGFAGSSSLAAQITSGAPADVFAAASPATMRTVEDSGDAVDPQVLVRNTLEIAVPPGNPGGITGLADLTRPELKIALCTAEVPCGAASATVFEAAGLTPAPDTLEQDVKATLNKVALGEVDAGLVYRTDVIAAGDTVEGVGFPQAGEAVNEYPITVLRESPNPDAAAAFVAFVRSAEGVAVLEAAGFVAP